MYWPFVAVHLVIIALLSNDAFPITELKEIEQEDIHLVDKARKGRFIQVNQTTFLPNPIELIRAKKSSPEDAEHKPIDVMGSDKKEKQSPTTSKVLPAPIHVQKPYRREDFVGENSSSSADSLFEPQTFGYPSFFEDHFRKGCHQTFIGNPMNCCYLDHLINTFTGTLSCVDEYIVPQANLFC